MEIVELYVRDKESSVVRPFKELKGFEKVSLRPGESKKIAFNLDKRAFAYYETAINDWFVEYGEFEIMIGASSRDIRLTGSVYVNTDKKLPVQFTFNSTLQDIMSCPEGKEMFADLFDRYCKTMDWANGDGLGEGSKELVMAMIKDTPIRGLLCYDDRP